MPPPLSSPCGRRNASRRRADRRACRRQRSSSFPRSIRSHADRCSCLCVNAAVSKAAWWPWPLTFWPWKWCPSHVWRGLPVCQYRKPQANNCDTVLTSCRRAAALFQYSNKNVLFQSLEVPSNRTNHVLPWKQAVGVRPPRYAPAPLFPLWVPKRLAPPSRPQRSSSFPRPIRSHAHHCSCLTR